MMNPAKSAQRIKVPRKRYRNSVVCTFCRKRKVKCDKEQPCHNCIKYGNDDCVYEDGGNNDPLEKEREDIARQNEIRILKNKLRKLEQEVPSSAATDEKYSVSSENSQDPEELHVIDKKRYSDKKNVSHEGLYQEFLGHNPIADPNDTTSFYLTGNAARLTCPSPLRRAYLPFDWITLLRFDNALLPMSDSFARRHSLRTDQNGNKSSTSSSSHEKSFETKNNFIEGKNDLEEFPNPYTGDTTPSNPVDNSDDKQLPSIKTSIKNHVNKTGSMLGHLYFEGDLNQVSTLCKKIGLVLPNKRVIFRLMRLFFMRFYPIAPILDEQDFVETLTKIIGPISNLDEKPQITIKKKLDFAVLGTLLILLRLSYLTLFSTSPQNNFEAFSLSEDPEFRYLLDNPVSLDSVFLAKECLALFDLFTSASLPVFQLVMLVRLYITYAPEEGDGDRATEMVTFNGLLTNMAITLGLNQDPDLLFGDSMSPRMKNLNRKLWWMVYYTCISQTLLVGAKLGISPGDHNTKLPFYEPGNHNSNDLRLEKALSKMHVAKSSVKTITDQFLSIILDVRGNVNMYTTA